MVELYNESILLNSHLAYTLPGYSIFLMGHLSKDNKKLIARVRRLKGQLEGVERMLTSDTDCYEILQNVAACRGAFNALTRQLIHEHIEHHLIEEPTASDATRTASKEMQAIIDSFLK